MSTTAATQPPAPGTGSGNLPPTFQPTTSTATTTLPTAGTTTSYDATTTAGGYKTIPAPGSCGTTPPPVTTQGPMTQTGGGLVAGQFGAPDQKGPIQGGGGGDLASVLSQLTSLIGQLQTAVGGVAGGGPGGKPIQGDPNQGKPPVPGGGQVAGVDGGGKTDPSQCAHAGQHGTQAGGAPAPGTVAGQNGAPAADAAAAAANVNGGGGLANNAALVTALQGVIQALNALIQALGGQVAGVDGGGPGGKQPDPTQMGKPPVVPPPSDVDDAKGPGTPDQKGPDPKPVTPPPVTPPPVTPPPVTPPPTTQVGDQNGPGDKGPDPTQMGKPPVVPPPSQVSPANGGPDVGQDPSPVQQGKPTPAQVLADHEGNVRLINDDEKWSAKLVSEGTKGENSVELWGDPHVVVTTDGVAERFDIGHGAGSVTLFDGTVVTWDTYAKGDKLAGQRPGANDDVSYILRNFSVDSPVANNLDRTVTTRDRDGDKGDQTLTTALTDAHLKELAIALRTMQGDWKEPLKNGTWVSPAYQNPNQSTTQTGGTTTQQS